MDNKKEYILCAAYPIKDAMFTPNESLLKEKYGYNRGVYYPPADQVYTMVTGWRHCDILHKFGDLIDKDEGGGFMTSKGRYVDRKEAMKIALACGQVEEGKTIHGSDGLLFSEDLY